MRLQRLSPGDLDPTFWQVLCVASPADFLAHGERFLAAVDIASPGTRVDVALHRDGPDAPMEEAGRLLGRLAGQAHGSLVYRAWPRGNARGEVQRARRLRWNTAAAALEATRRPTLLLSPQAIVSDDLSLLPAALSKADVAFGPGADVVWLNPGERTLSFLGEVRRILRGTRRHEPTEAEAVARAYRRCAAFLKVVALPARYAGEGAEDLRAAIRVFAREADADAATARARAEFSASPDVVVVAPRQDIGPLRGAEEEDPSARMRRATRPPARAFRHAPALFAALARAEGLTPRVVSVAPWQVDAGLVARFPEARQILLPHTSRTFVRDPRAAFYARELQPQLVTRDRDGWGASASWAGTGAFRHDPVDPRLAAFLAAFRADSRLEPAKESAGGDGHAFDVLAVLQAPDDPALVQHGAVDTETFVAALSAFARTSGVGVLFVRHPDDASRTFARLKSLHAHARATFVEDAPLTRLLALAKAVATINADAGFEAMCHGVPVLSFGRAAYDEAVTPACPDTIEAAYVEALAEPAEARRERHERFVSWALYTAGLKIDEPVVNVAADRLAPPVLADNPVAAAVADDLLAGGEAIEPLPRPFWRWASPAAAAYAWQRLGPVAMSVGEALDAHVIRPAGVALRLPLLSLVDPEMFTGKSVALVGNAASLREGTAGAEIDAHDIVIRMNLGHPLIVRKDCPESAVPREHLAGVFVDGRSSGREHHPVLSADAPEDVVLALTHAAAVGRRTTLWSCSTADRNRQRFFGRFFDCKAVACHPDFHHLSLRFLVGRKVMRLPEAPYRRLRKAMRAEPTSGLIWIEYLAGTKLERLTVYGIDSYASGHINRTTAPTLKVRGRWPHDPVGERWRIGKIVQRDVRIRLARAGEGGGPGGEPETGSRRAAAPAGTGPSATT